jgi:hypothetical protein
MSAFNTEKQSKYPPSRLAGLTPFRPDQSGNPGGQQKGICYPSHGAGMLMVTTDPLCKCKTSRNLTEVIISSTL